MLECFPTKVPTQYDSVDKISFPDTNSTFYIGTAGSRAFGRGDTISKLHCSEFAFWPNADRLFAGLREAVPEHGTIVIESTPNGLGNFFNDMWESAGSEHNPFTKHFYPWYWHYEYMEEEHAPEPFTEDERKLLNKGVKPWQLQWRRKKLGVGPGENPPKKIYDMFLQEYPEDEISCFLQSGRPVFEAEYCKLEAERAMPKPSRQYVIGADTSEGLAKGDYSYACVIRRDTGEQVEFLHGKWPPDVFANKLYELGHKYNTALIGVERNNHGHAVILQLKTRGYGKIYTHDDKRFGWLTTAKNKGLMIDEMEKAVREKHLLLSDTDLLAEMLTFQYNEKGSAEAAEGKHDDRVMGTAIAWMIRNKPQSRAFTNKPAGF